MPVDYNILARVPSVGSRFVSGMEAGREAAIRNQLLQQQQQDRAMQMEDRRRQMQQAQQQEAIFQQAADLIRKSGLDPDDPAVLQQFTAAAVQSRNPQLISLAGQMTERSQKRRQATEERARVAAIMGGQPQGAMPMAAPNAMPGAAPPPAPRLETTIIDEGGARPEAVKPPVLGAQPSPVTPPVSVTTQPLSTGQPRMNALAPAVAPVNAMTAPVADPRLAALQMEIDTKERQRARLLADGSPEAMKLAAALQADLSRLDREYQRLQPKAGPASVQEMQAYMRMTPEERQTFERLQKLKGTSVTVGAQEKAFEAGLGAGQSKKILEDKAVAEDAASIIETARRGKELLQGPMITGFGAEALTQIGSALNQIGFNFAEDAVANTQAFSANMAQNVGRIIKQFGAGTGLSNADREYAEKMAGGKVTLDRKAIERILDINERAARNVIARHNKNVSGIKTNIPLTVESPPEPASGKNRRQIAPGVFVTERP